MDERIRVQEFEAFSLTQPEVRNKSQFVTWSNA